jgi:hypothetical protein
MPLDQSLSQRLQSKTVKQSIITNIAKDFNLTPILAEAYFTQISDYFLRHAELTLSTGQLQYLAVEENEPAGKPIALCRKVPVRLGSNPSSWTSSPTQTSTTGRATSTIGNSV